ncbi:hypothetical protein [Streptomyces cucumeris]|uniref:hypothetical protein n=1 Tax=Streptomyces cucumeris TaxID=2962890 RepID=UPI003D70A0A9
MSEALAAAREAGCIGTRILRADSQFYNAGVIAACHRTGATGMNPSIKRTVHSIPNDAWQHISYPTALPDPETGELIPDAEVAEISEYTAFASRTPVTARMIVRRVRDLVKPAVVGEPDEGFPVWRYHPSSPTSPPAVLLRTDPESDRRPPRHLPDARFSPHQPHL